MFKQKFQLRLFLAGLSVAASALSVKREISDSHHSSGTFADSFPLTVTATLGSDAFSPLDYAGSLGNLYARTDDDGLTTGYEYPQYALGYGQYEPYTADVTPGLEVALSVSSEELGDDVSWGSYYGGPQFLPLNRGFRGLAAGYPYEVSSGFSSRPDFYYGRLRGYY